VVGGVDDRIERERRDVAFDHFDFHVRSRVTAASAAFMRMA
jgi:hypothetical protein